MDFIALVDTFTSASNLTIGLFITAALSLVMTIFPKNGLGIELGCTVCLVFLFLGVMVHDVEIRSTLTDAELQQVAAVEAPQAVKDFLREQLVKNKKITRKDLLEAKRIYETELAATSPGAKAILNGARPEPSPSLQPTPSN